MTNNVIRRVILLGAIAILSLIAVQTFWVLRTWDLQEREFNRKVSQALLDTAKDLENHYRNFVLPSKELVTQVYSNYYVVNIENQFDAPTLEFYLQRAFEKQAMREDFQYGIFDCSSNQMVAGKTIKYTAKAEVQEPLNEPLPTHSDYLYYFGVRFPGRSANILSNMWYVVAFTGLMLITVAFFIYAMFVILRQKQLSEQQRDFINNMTHEFKTPISTINISTDVFLQNEQIKGDQRLHRYAGIIKEQVMRLNTQVEKVLQLAKIDRERVELHLEDIQLAELIRHITPSLELKIGEKKGALILDLNETDALVKADRLHLTNIIHNLVDNGVKYAREKPEIRIGLNRDNGATVLSVQDNGIGIAKEHQRKVFDKFYRVPTGNVHNVKGFGLGLFYVREICRQHDWRLQIDSAVGKGTKISILIPK